MSTSITRYLRNIVSGVLIVTAALFAYSPTASAWTNGYNYGYSGYGYSGYAHIWDKHISEMCVNSPENRCFLVVSFNHDCPFPFFQRMDQGFWYHGHYYQYYHRYYTYQYYNNGNNNGFFGFGNNNNFFYHTVYYYTY